VEAQVHRVTCDPKGTRQVRHVKDAESQTVFLQDPPYWLDKPARIAKLEGVGQIGRQKSGESLQPFCVGAPVGRQLPQNGAESAAQPLRPRQEPSQRLGSILEMFEI
jgi:hypothetical protein